MIIRRIISVLLLLFMMAPLMVFSAANFDDDGNRTEENGLEEEEYERPVQELEIPDDVYVPPPPDMVVIREIKIRYDQLSDKMELLGVWEKPDFEYVEKVTRGEFAGMVARLVNVRISTDEMTFDDVEYENIHRNDIEALVDMGIISAADDGMFRPHENIQFCEAVTMLMRALGYEPYVKAMEGDFPLNYLAAALSNKLLKQGEILESESSINRNDAENLIWAALDVKVFDREFYGRQETYTKEETALYYFHQIEKYKGIVGAVGELYIDGEGPVTSESVKIGDIVFEGQGVGFLNLLGHTVDVYYMVDNDNNLKLLLTDNNEIYNTVLELDDRNIPRLKDGKIVYYDKETNRERTALLGSDIKALINWFEPSDFDYTDIDGADEMLLTDNNNDGEYDVLQISKTSVYVVTGANEEIKKVYDYYSKNVIDIDFGSPDVVLVDHTGTAVAPYFIQEWSVLSVGYNKNRNKMRVIVSNRPVTGTVTEVSNAGNSVEGSIAIDDTVYYFSSNYAVFAGANAPKAGNKYSFYLDYRGRIAGFSEQTRDALLHGYLVKVASDGGLSSRVKFMIFPYSEDMTVYQAADKVTVDGKTLSCSKVMNELENITNSLNDRMAQINKYFNKPAIIYNNGALYVRQPVMYKVNSKNEVIYLDTPFCGDDEDTDNRANVFGRKTMTMYEDFVRHDDVYKNPGGTFFHNTMLFSGESGHTIEITKDMKLFIVPISNDFKVLDDENNYSRAKMDYFSFYGYYPTVRDATSTGTMNDRLEAYNVAKDRSCPVLVYYRTLSVGRVLDKTTPLTIVTKAVKALNDDGEMAEFLYGYQGNSEIKVQLATNTSLTKQFNGPGGTVVESTVRRGDIIRYETNYKGEISGYTKVFSLTDEDNPYIVVTGNETAVAPSSGLDISLLAVSDGKYAGNGYSVDAIGNSDFRLVYKMVLYKNGSNLVLKSALNDGDINEKFEICDATSFNIVCIDEELDRIYVPDTDEIVSAYNSSEENATRVILHTGAGKQKMLVLVRRKSS